MNYSKIYIERNFSFSPIAVAEVPRSNFTKSARGVNFKKLSHFMKQDILQN